MADFQGWMTDIPITAGAPDADPLLAVLRGVLVAGVVSGAGDGIDSTQHRAGAALYALLLDHEVDQRGRCRSCRRPSAVLGLPRRHCRVRGKAELWLRLPVELLQSFLASLLGRTPAPPVPKVGQYAG